MRKRRAIFFDDEPAILNLLTLVFEERGYEVFAFHEPVDCPIYDGAGRCDKKLPCGDLMITDLDMPRMSGLELIKLQTGRGCTMDVRNKAVLSGNLDPATQEAIRLLGCRTFLKPCRLSELTTWAGECEQRMDLSRPLGIRRWGRREACDSGEVYNFEWEAGLHTGVGVNRSDSGLCVRFANPLAVGQMLSVHSPRPLPSDRLRVRWMMPDADGRFLAGLSYC